MFVVYIDAVQVCYIINSAGQSVTMTINGETRIPMFVKEADANKNRAA